MVHLSKQKSVLVFQSFAFNIPVSNVNLYNNKNIDKKFLFGAMLFGINIIYNAQC